MALGQQQIAQIKDVLDGLSMTASERVGLYDLARATRLIDRRGTARLRFLPCFREGAAHRQGGLSWHCEAHEVFGRAELIHGRFGLLWVFAVANRGAVVSAQLRTAVRPIAEILIPSAGVATPTPAMSRVSVRPPGLTKKLG